MAASIISKNNIKIIGKQDAEHTIVFGHGFGTDQTSFAGVVPAFENDYRIVLFDNAGGGKSDIASFNPVRYSSLSGYVTDLIDICKHLELKDVYYVGHSVNGMVSLLASIKAPQFFSKLILLGASPRYLNDASQGYIGGFEQADLDGFYEAMNTNYYAWASGFSKVAMSNDDKPHLAEQFAETLSAVRPDIALGVSKAIFQSDHRADLPKSGAPTLIVQTSDDVAVPVQVGDYMHRHIPNSSLLRVNIKGHFPQISAPGEVVGAIQSFI